MSKTKKFLSRIDTRFQGWMTLALSLFLLTACAAGGGSNADRTAIQEEIAASDLFGMELTDTDDGGITSKSSAGTDGEVQDERLLMAADGTAYLTFWWRTGVHRVSRNVDISIVEDTASVTVTDQLEGTLKVIQDGGIWEKPIEETLTRHAEFERNPVDQRPPLWQLTRISPVDVSLKNEAQQTVRIERIRASRCVSFDEDNGSCTEWETVWETDSSASLFDVPEQLPTFSQGDRILVEATVSNTDDSYEPSEFVYLHRPGLRGIFPGRVRDRMVDNGTWGDQTAGDGVYSHVYTVLNPGYHFAAVDVMNAAALMEETAPYNSAAWGMPYRVVVP